MHRSSTAIRIVCLLAAGLPFWASGGDAPPTAPAGYPEFSWQTVPQFAFISLTVSEKLTDEQVRFLANTYSLVTICQHGRGRPGESVEHSTFDTAARLKAVRPAVKVLGYWNSTLSLAGPAPSAVFATHDDWALRDADGKLVTLRRCRLHDLSNPDVRDWWSDYCRVLTANPAIDGVFADATCKYGMAVQGILKGLTAGKEAALKTGLDETYALAERKMGPGKLLIFNGLRGNLKAWDGGLRYLDHTSGAMVEHFAAFTGRDRDGKLIPEQLANDIELIGKAADEGKIVLVKGWPGPTSWFSPGFAKLTDADRQRIAAERLTFPLAAFLVAAGKYCYFSYTFGYLTPHGALTPPAELAKPLGPPLGKAVRQGWVYTRHFQHADVEIDLATEQAKIDWH